MSLCLECGACCDGTMFPHAELSADEAARLGDRVEVNAGKLVQPCRALSGCACTVYEARPTTCRAYRCLALQQLEAGETTLDEARQAIGELLARRDAVVALVGGPQGEALRTGSRVARVGSARRSARSDRRLRGARLDSSETKTERAAAAEAHHRVHGRVGRASGRFRAPSAHEAAAAAALS